MNLQLLHRRGGGTFGQTERKAGMKQKLLTQVRIELLHDLQQMKHHQGPYCLSNFEFRSVSHTDIDIVLGVFTLLMKEAYNHY